MRGGARLRAHGLPDAFIQYQSGCDCADVVQPGNRGLAKGQLVKEIDALGGEMGKITDKTATHFRLLNASKGPAVQSSRMQCDKQLYRLTMKATVENQKISTSARRWSKNSLSKTARS